MNTNLALHREIEAEGERCRTDESAYEPGSSVASFPTWGQAQRYALECGPGHCITADVHLGYSVRKLMPFEPLSQQSSMRRV
jgi:hypothetical protein